MERFLKIVFVAGIAAAAFVAGVVYAGSSVEDGAVKGDTAYWIQTGGKLPKTDRKVIIALGKFDSRSEAEQYRKYPCLALSTLDFGFPGAGIAARKACEKYAVTAVFEVVQKTDWRR